MIQKIKNNPYSREKEITTLRKLGLRSDEIDYLMWLKMKRQIRRKWEH